MGNYNPRLDIIIAHQKCEGHSSVFRVWIYKREVVSSIFWLGCALRSWAKYFFISRYSNPFTCINELCVTRTSFYLSLRYSGIRVEGKLVCMGHCWSSTNNFLQTRASERNFLVIPWLKKKSLHWRVFIFFTICPLSCRR